MKYFLYCRRSTDDEKQALSIESQLYELKEKYGTLEIVDEITEDCSAYKPGRPKFKAMMQRVQKGEADGIIVWHPDRLARNPIDAGVILYALDMGKLKDLKFGSYHFTNTPEGKMMLGIMLSQSKYYSEKLGIDSKRGMETKCRLGHLPEKAPTGYINVNPGKRGTCYIDKDPVRFLLVQKMWKLFLTGAYNVPQLLKIVRDEWHLTLPPFDDLPERPITLGAIYKIFSNEFYYGHFEWDGEWYKGAHEPMITLAEFKKVQKILGREGKQRNEVHDSPYTGLMTCGCCGSAITADVQVTTLKDGTKKTYVYYRSTKKKGHCTQKKSLSEKDLVAQFRAIIANYTVPRRFVLWAARVCERFLKEDCQLLEQQKKEWRKEFDKYETQIRELVRLYASERNGDRSLLSEEDYKKQKGDLVRLRDHYDALLQDNKKNVDKALDLTVQTFEFASNALKFFDKKDDTSAKRIVLVTIGSKWTLTDGIVQCEAKIPFKKIREGIISTELLRGRLEKRVHGSVETKTLVTVQESSIWQPHGESNPDLQDENLLS